MWVTARPNRACAASSPGSVFAADRVGELNRSAPSPGAGGDGPFGVVTLVAKSPRLSKSASGKSIARTSVAGSRSVVHAAGVGKGAGGPPWLVFGEGGGATGLPRRRGATFHQRTSARTR